MMDSSTLEICMKEYEDFLRNCNLVEEEKLPQHELEIVWKNVDVRSFLEERKTAKLESKNQVFHNREATRNQKNSPFLDVNWSIELELLAVVDDGTMSQNYHVPFEKSQMLATFDLPSQAGSSESSNSERSETGQVSSQETEIGRMNRLRGFRDGISRRIRGLRPTEHSRSLRNTLQLDPSNPDCVLLVVVKWEGPSEGGFSVIGATLKVGFETLTATEPLAAHSLNENSFLLESSSTLHWAIQGYERRRQNAVGLKTRRDWISSLPDPLHPQQNQNSITLSLTVQLNELSIPRIGFPFARFLVTDREDFDNTIEALCRTVSQDEAGQYAVVQAPSGQTYSLLKDDLSKTSAFFRAFLTEKWEHSSGDGTKIQFPLVPPFTTCPDLIPLIVHFIAKKFLLFGLSENAADLIVAADALGMPELMRLAEIATVGNINLENVTQLVRLAWQFQANLLFRATLIFLRANYDEIWVKNHEDLADLGRLLSNDKFLLAFKMNSFPSNFNIF